jgi:hypothetical protein
MKNIPHKKSPGPNGILTIGVLAFISLQAAADSPPVQLKIANTPSNNFQLTILSADPASSYDIQKRDSLTNNAPWQSLISGTQGQSQFLVPKGNGAAGFFRVSLHVPISVTVTPPYLGLLPGATQTFTATVAGTTNQSVTWKVVESGGGSISAAGLYTAPTSNSTFHVRAISQANTNSSGDATVLALSTNGTMPHPRLWLTTDLLTRLRQRAATNDPAWLALRADCDDLASRPVEYPDGTGGGPNAISGGYQYFDYLDPMFMLGLGYQVASTVDTARATNYASQGRQILLALSDPVHHGRESTDSGWSIRAYGNALGIGYDWFYNTLTAPQRTQIYGEANRWVQWFDTNGFGRDFPQGNYFAGYYSAKGICALATEGDNPLASTMWNDWSNHLHFGMVQPYYQPWLAGGGWPEGWNYGQNGTLNMLRPVLAARTAKGLDLLHHPTKPFSYPEGTALWAINFIWPDRQSIDDRGLIYESDDPTEFNNSWPIEFSGLLRQLGSSSSPRFQKFVSEQRTQFGAGGSSWSDFLFWDANAPQADYQTALSYRTGGDGQVSMRSAWNTNSIWAAFQAGPYTGYDGAGEQFFDEGSLTIRRGSVPFLVNASGAVQRNTPGTDDASTDCYGTYCGSSVYGENWDVTPEGIYHARRIYNVFYANRSGGYWGQYSQGPGDTLTTLDRFEDRGGYVFMRAVNLEGMYLPVHPITNWVRNVAYLRPKLFVVYDRTAVRNTTNDQWMAWHVYRTPSEQAGAFSGTHRFDVKDGTLFRGSVTTVLPAGHTNQIVNVFATSKVYRLEVRPGSPTVSNRWLTVFDASDASTNVCRVSPFTAASGNVVAGNIEGAYLASPIASGTNTVVLFNTTASDLSGSLTLHAPATNTVYLLNGFVPASGHSINVTTASGQHTIQIGAGSGFIASATGSLYFRIDAAGTVTQL